MCVIVCIARGIVKEELHLKIKADVILCFFFHAVSTSHEKTKSNNLSLSILWLSAQSPLGSY